MKNILILLFLYLCTACSTTKTVPKEPVVVNPVVVNPVVVNPVPEVSLVKLLSTKGFKTSELDKLNKAIIVMNKTIAGKCFKEFIQARPGLHTTGGRTAEEVVNHLRTSEVEIHLIMYSKRFSRVAGYTYPNVNKIWLNRRYHAGASLCSKSSNLAHELSHKLGYTHAYKPSKTRPFSVPYSINAAFTTCCK